MSDRDEDQCLECGSELEADEKNICDYCRYSDDEDDFLSGVTCNPDAPEECESCQ